MRASMNARSRLPSVVQVVKGLFRGAFDGASALVGVNVVRPVGRSTLTPRARRRAGAAVPGSRGFSAGVGAGSVVGAGPGSGLSEEPTSGVIRSVTLDCRVVPECPPGPALPSICVCVVASATSWR